MDEFYGDLTGLYKERKLDMILELTESLAPTHSQSPRLFNIAGAAFAELGKPDKAAAQFRESIELDPSQGAAYRNLGILRT